MISWRPMKRFCVRGGEYGINISSDSYQDHGVRLLRTTDIDEDGKLRNDDAVFISVEHADGMHLSSRDILFSRSGTLGRAYLHTNASEPMTFAGYLVRFTPLETVDCRYIRYCSQASFFSDQISADAVVSTIANFNAERYSAVAVPWHNHRAQAAIADFLDTETARIDALVAKKRQMLQLLTERSARLIERGVRDLVKQHGEQRLKTAARDITVGIVITPSVWYSEEGVPALRGLNVRPHKIDLSDLVRLSAEGHRIHAKSKLYAGDVVVVRTGQAGAAAVVPPALNGANCIDLLIVRPGSLDAKFLAYVLNSDWTHKHISKYSVGTIQSHFNVSSLAELPIPAAPLDEQRRFVLNIDAQLARLEATQAKLSDQLELLREHRQALITAAVTGEMDVPGVPA